MNIYIEKKGEMLHNYKKPIATTSHCGNAWDRNTTLLHVNYLLLYDYYSTKLDLKFFFI